MISVDYFEYIQKIDEFVIVSDFRQEVVGTMRRTWLLTYQITEENLIRTLYGIRTHMVIF